MDVNRTEEKVLNNSEIHVLLVTLSAQGHINPMLMLAKSLVAKGVHVTLATTEVSRKFMGNKGPSTSNSKFHWEYFSDGLADDFDRKDIEVYFQNLFTFGPPNVSNLITKLSDVKKVSCIMYNPFVPWVVDVAVEHKIPCAMLWIQPCAVYAIYYHFYNELNPFPTLENPDLPINLPGLPSLSMDHMPSFIHPSDPYPCFKRLLVSMIKNLDKVQWVLGTSFYELEKNVVDEMGKFHPITPIGPLVSPTILGRKDVLNSGADMWRPDDSCIDWLDMQPPSSVLYISFGSILELSSIQIANIALALKSVKKPFLWALKNPDKLPTGFIEETKHQGLVVGWCRQAKVLSHTSIGCFMSHCGWNSLLEAISSGVPVIALPYWSDQPANGQMLVHIFKSGILVKRDSNGTFSKEEVERCILDITQGPVAMELKENAGHWKVAAREAVSDGGSTDKNLDVFIDDIRGP